MKTRHLLSTALLILLLAGADASPASAQKLKASTGLQPPIATGWMYMADDPNYDQIPSDWMEIDFTKMDVLNIGPVGIQADGTFGLYESAAGDLATRFKWILKTARAQNPDVKIIASQWWGDGEGTHKWGRALSSLSVDGVGKYAQSVHDFIVSYMNESGGIDGYDIDYEGNNVTCLTAAVISSVHAHLAALSEANQGRRFYLTVSPADTSYLQDSVNFLDFVNMQTYAGGTGLTPEIFTSMGFQSEQLLYGICPETSCFSPSVDQAKSAYTDSHLAGIHVWRLNSDNYQQEGQVQKEVYEFLHP